MELDRKKIAEIFNSEIKQANFDFEVDTVLESDIKPEAFLSLKNIIQFEKNRNPINSIFNQLSKDRFNDFGQFHHFKNVQITLDIIKNKSIQISSLSSNDTNDFAEYTEFFKRTGHFYPLVAADFQKKAWENKLNPQDDSPADVDRKEIFILCFTQDNHNENFWRNYADKDHGVAIGFRFSRFEENKKWLFDFRDIFYDKGYSFDFLNSINYQLKKHHNKVVLLDGIVQFSKFYKRAKYNWENETRLCFHYDDHPLLNHRAILNKIFPVHYVNETGRNYINLPLIGNEQLNPFFDLTITEVVCGKFVSETDFKEIAGTLKASFPKAIIWQRR